MILGIGCDIVETKRILGIKQKDAFARKILSDREIEVYSVLIDEKKQSFLAGRFAAKEAFSKAMGCGIGEKVSWRDISVLNDDSGAPYIIFSQLECGCRVHVSIAHEREYAVAYCILSSL